MTIPSTAAKTCPYCRIPIKPEGEIVACSACGIQYHKNCWQEKKRCARQGCAGHPVLSQGVGAGSRPTGQSVVPPPPTINAAVQRPPTQTSQAQEIYLEGNDTLVIRDGGSFPPVCMASGQTDDLVKCKRTESWAPSWAPLLMLLCFPAGAITYLCVKKSIKFNYYLEKGCVTRRLCILIANSILFAGAFIGSIEAFSKESIGLGFILMIASILIPTILYFIFLQMYSIQKIENGYLWIKFANPKKASAIYSAYLNQRNK